MQTSPTSRTSRFFDAGTWIWSAAVLYIGINLALCIFRTAFEAFDSDELQHAHVAWLIASGKVIYRDFWEHHGPVYSLLGGAAIYLGDMGRSMDILFLGRVFSGLVSAAILAVTFAIARVLSMSAKASVVAVAILSSLIYFQDNGTEMRPDPLQALFWLTGLLLALRNLSRPSIRLAVMAGALFALSILTNAKAAIGPFFVFLFYVSGWRVHGLSRTEVTRALLAMIAGGLAVFTVVSSYFLFTGAFVDFLYLNYIENFLLLQGWLQTDTSDWLGSDTPLWLVNLRFFIRYQSPFLALAAAGWLLWVYSLRSAGDHRDGGVAGCFLAVTAGTTSGSFLNLYSQFFLVFLPLLSICASFALFRLTRVIRDRAGLPGTCAVISLVVLSSVIMVTSAIGQTPFARQDPLDRQISLTQRIVAETRGTDPVGVFWNICGGFMFNDNPQYYWAIIPGLGEGLDRAYGENPFGESFRQALVDRDVRYVVGGDDWIVTALPEASRAYLHEHYSYADCLWTRHD